MADIADLVRRFYARLWEAGTYDEAPDILHQNLIFRGSVGMEKNGIDGFLDYARMVRGALADYRCDILDLVAEGDRAAAKMHFHGVHRDTFMGVEATGRHIGWHGAAFFQVQDARLAEIWVLGNTDELRAKLAGDTPESP